MAFDTIALQREFCRCSTITVHGDGGTDRQLPPPPRALDGDCASAGIYERLGPGW